MRTAFLLGRLCSRQKPQRLISRVVQYGRHQAIRRRWAISGRLPPRPSGTQVTILSLLSPAAFVALSEEENGDGKTPEAHMLEASRAEIAKELPDDVTGWRRAWRGVCLGLDVYIIEPIATTLRFFHLFIIFVPVLATIPLIWIGSRQNAQHNERSGTLWWYSFLVRSMERAGPAFIKVGQPVGKDRGYMYID